MKVLIVIPCLNEEDYIERCLNSITEQKQDVAIIETVVVDGGSTDGTLNILADIGKKMSGLRVLDNPERVTPISLNIGLKSAQADVKIILGAHSELTPNFVSEVIHFLQQHPDAGCVGGVILNQYENEKSELIGVAMSSAFGVGNVTFRTGGKDGPVDTVAFGAYREEVFDRIGYFDEDLVRNQDDEFNYRLNKAGFKIWFTERITSKYFVRASIKKLFKQYFQYGYWKVYVNKKHKTVTTIRQLVPLFFVLFLWGGSILSFLDSTFFVGFLFILICYVVAGLYFAGVKTKGWSQRFKVLFIFFVLHYSYGIGYLKGILRFFIQGKSPALSQKSISR